LSRARAGLLRAQIAFASAPGREAVELLLDAARRLEPLDDELARETYLDGFSAAILSDLAAAATVARAVRALPAVPEPSRVGLLLDGQAARFADGYAAAAPARRRAVDAVGGDDLPMEEGLRWLWLASFEAAELWDDEGWVALTARHVELARAAGALSVLPLTLPSLAVAHVFAGELDAAASLLAEHDAVRQATGIAIAPYAALTLAAWRGRDDDVGRILGDQLGEVIARGEDSGVVVAHWAKAVLANGRGRYDDAVTAAREAADHPSDAAPAKWALIELVEAAARAGQVELATEALARVDPILRAGGTDWALGLRARADALLSDGEAAEALYGEAIARLGRTRLRGEHARAHLLYGEWLRRTDRRVDARTQLRTAYELLAAVGADAFAERGRRELVATGETVRRSRDTREALTPQEAQIARLAADGHTNPEIGARLFISPRTVEYHLRKVFGKLDVSSRRELGDALG
jgi:DNA-binding CsgD family transcriptional regulator